MIIRHLFSFKTFCCPALYSLLGGKMCKSTKCVNRPFFFAGIVAADTDIGHQVANTWKAS